MDDKSDKVFKEPIAPVRARSLTRSQTRAQYAGESLVVPPSKDPDPEASNKQELEELTKLVGGYHFELHQFRSDLDMLKTQAQSSQSDFDMFKTQVGNQLQEIINELKSHRACLEQSERVAQPVPVVKIPTPVEAQVPQVVTEDNTGKASTRQNGQVVYIPEDDEYWENVPVLTKAVMMDVFPTLLWNGDEWQKRMKHTTPVFEPDAFIRNHKPRVLVLEVDSVILYLKGMQQDLQKYQVHYRRWTEEALTIISDALHTQSVDLKYSSDDRVLYRANFEVMSRRHEIYSRLSWSSFVRILCSQLLPLETWTPRGAMLLDQVYPRAGERLQDFVQRALILGLGTIGPYNTPSYVKFFLERRLVPYYTLRPALRRLPTSLSAYENARTLVTSLASVETYEFPAYVAKTDVVAEETPTVSSVSVPTFRAETAGRQQPRRKFSLGYRNGTGGQKKWWRADTPTLKTNHVYRVRRDPTSEDVTFERVDKHDFVRGARSYIVCAEDGLDEERQQDIVWEDASGDLTSSEHLDVFLAVLPQEVSSNLVALFSDSWAPVHEGQVETPNVASLQAVCRRLAPKLSVGFQDAPCRS